MQGSVDDKLDSEPLCSYEFTVLCSVPAVCILCSGAKRTEVLYIKVIIYHTGKTTA